MTTTPRGRATPTYDSPLPSVHWNEHRPQANQAQECRRLATYLRTAAARTDQPDFAARMLIVAKELEQRADVLKPPLAH